MRSMIRPSPRERKRFQPKGHDIVFDHVGFAYDKKKVLDGCELYRPGG